MIFFFFGIVISSAGSSIGGSDVGDSASCEAEVVFESNLYGDVGGGDFGGGESTDLSKPTTSNGTFF